MASILKVDALQGVTSAGAITVTSEGGTATQSLQQGLCKAWLQGNSDASTDDDFNIASGTDNGTGDYTYSFTANMNNNTHIATGMSSDNNAEIIHSNSRSTTVQLLETALKLWQYTEI
jgi:hypothetical protein